VSVIQTVTAGQTVSVGQTVSAGQTVSVGQTVSAGQTVPAGQAMSAGQTVTTGQTNQNKSKISVLKLSIGSSTSPENSQTLKDKFFGIRLHFHGELCTRFMRFLKREMCNGNLFTT